MQVQSKKSQEELSPPEARVQKTVDYSLKGSSFRLGKQIERGCFNYRWPVNEYSLLLNNGPDDLDPSDKETGTCVMFSFVQNGVLYQVLRIEQGCRSGSTCYLFPLDAQVVLTIGGNVFLQLLEDVTASNDPSPARSCGNIPGRKLTTSLSNDGQCLRIADDGREIGLEARVFQMDADGADYSPLTLQSSARSSGTQAGSSPTTPHMLRTESATTNSSALVPSAFMPVGDDAAGDTAADAVYTAIAKLHAPTLGEACAANRRGRATAFIATRHALSKGKDDGSEPVSGQRNPSSEVMRNDVGVRETSGLNRIVLSRNENAARHVQETCPRLGRDLRTDLTSEFTGNRASRCLLDAARRRSCEVDLVPAPLRADDPAESRRSDVRAARERYIPRIPP